jgi:hypothetical protein
MPIKGVWTTNNCPQKGVGIQLSPSRRKGLSEIFMDADVDTPSMGVTPREMIFPQLSKHRCLTEQQKCKEAMKL